MKTFFLFLGLLVWSMNNFCHSAHWPEFVAWGGGLGRARNRTLNIQCISCLHDIISSFVLTPTQYDHVGL